MDLKSLLQAVDVVTYQHDRELTSDFYRAYSKEPSTRMDEKRLSKMDGDEKDAVNVLTNILMHSPTKSWKSSDEESSPIPSLYSTEGSPPSLSRHQYLPLMEMHSIPNPFAYAPSNLPKSKKRVVTGPISNDLENTASLLAEPAKPFQCNWGDCRKAFPRRADLTRHFRIHQNIRPFACHHESCGKRFSQVHY